MTQHQPTGFALVTGGSRGIGRAISLRLAAAGHPIAVAYAQGAEAAEETVQDIIRAGGHAASFQVDIGDAAAIPGLFNHAEEVLGPLGALVANAGILGDQMRVDEQTPEGLTRLFAVNAVGTMLCAGEAVRRLSTRRGGKGGGIVAISSVAARNGGLTGLVPYAATKGAVESFVRGLANEVAKEGIRVNAVAPGLTATDMTADNPHAHEAAQKGVPMGRMGQPEEIAEAVAWLLSPASSYVTGTVVTVSGGR